MHIRLHVFDYLAFKPNIGEIFSPRYRDFEKMTPSPRLSLSSNLVRGLRGHAPGHFRVFRVSLDGLTKKRHCSSSTWFYQVGNVNRFKRFALSLVFSQLFICVCVFLFSWLLLIVTALKL